MRNGSGFWIIAHKPKVKFGILLAFMILLIIPSIHAVARLRITDYEIWDKGGNLAVEGHRICTTSGCGSTPSNWIITHSDITAGDNFIIKFNVTNFGDTTANAASLEYLSLRDPFFNLRDRGILDNFTSPDSVNINTNNWYIFTQYMNTSRYLYPGIFTLHIRTKGDDVDDLIYANISIGNTVGYYQMEVDFKGFTNYNDINYYTALDDTWDIYVNLTVTNRGSNSDTHFTVTDFSCYQRDIPCDTFSCNIGRSIGCTVPIGGTYDLPYGQQMNISCQLFNMTSTTRNVTGSCEHNSDGFSNCWGGGVSNLDFHFEIEDAEVVEGPLGNKCMDAAVINETFSFSSTQPAAGYYFTVPGLAFNYTVNITNYKFYSGTPMHNITTANNQNLNITWGILDDTLLNVLYQDWTPVLPQSITGTSINRLLNSPKSETSHFPWFIPQKPGITRLQKFLQSTTPIGSSPRYVIVGISPYNALALQVKRDGQNEFSNWGDCPCPTTGVPPIGFRCKENSMGRLLEKNLSLCLFGAGDPSNWINVNVTRLIEIDGQKGTIILYVLAGSTLTFPTQINNPLSNASNYTIVANPFKNYVIRPNIVFAPSEANIPKAGNTVPGSVAGSMHITTPVGVESNAMFRYSLTTASKEYPYMRDLAELIIIVVSHDVEILSINKTPSKFIYDPAIDPKVNLTFVIKNNLRAVENATLNVTIQTPLIIQTIESCGGQNITLQPFEVKNITCSPPTQIDFAGLGNSNVVIRADLALLSGIDSIPRNNHKLEILTVIDRNERPITIPEIHPLMIILIALLAGVFLRNGKGKLAIVLIGMLLLLPPIQAVTPEEFSTALDRFHFLYGDPAPATGIEIDPSNPNPNAVRIEPANSFAPVLERMKISYSQAYTAKANKEEAYFEQNYAALMSDFGQLQKMAPNFDFEPLKNEIKKEFGKFEDIKQFEYVPVQIAQGGVPTVKTIYLDPNNPNYVNPIDPGMEKPKKKNFALVILDLLWENSLIIGLFLIGMIVMYVIYHKDEDSPIVH